MIVTGIMIALDVIVGMILAILGIYQLVKSKINKIGNVTLIVFGIIVLANVICLLNVGV